MRKIVFILCLIFGVANSQDTTKYFKSNDYGWNWARGKFRANLIVPNDTINNKLGIAQIGSKLYVYTNKWVATSSTFDTSNIYFELSKKVNVNDTALMLLPYLRKNDTINKWLGIGWASIINSKVKYSDTALMLQPYLKFADTATIIATQNYVDNAIALNTIDTTHLSDRINLKLNINDTTNKWLSVGWINTINGKLNINDTLNKWLSSSWATTINNKLNISDTANKWVALGSVASGDLTGTYPSPTVHRVHNIDLQAGTPSVNDVWVYGGSPNKWQHQQLNTSQLNNNSGYVVAADTVNKWIGVGWLNTLAAKENQLTFTSPLNRVSNTISIPQSTSLINGYLSSTDWNTFNNKTSSQWTTAGSNIYYNNGVSIGTTTAPTGKLLVQGTTGTSEVMRLANEGTNTHTQLNFYNANSAPNSFRNLFSAFQSRGTLAAPTTLVSGDMTFGINGNGYDGTAYQSSASIDFIANGTIASGSLPQDILFRTGTSSTRATRMTIGSTGSVGIGGTGTAKLYIHGEGSTNDVLRLDNELTGGAVNTRMTMYNTNLTGAAGVGCQLITNQSRGTFAFPSQVVQGDYLYRHIVAGYDGSINSGKASIDYLVDGTVSAGGQLPTAIIFNTSSTTAARTERLRIASNGNIGLGVASPTAYLHIKAGTQTAGTAPIKLSTGTNLLATIENGAIEYDGSQYYASANGVRYSICKNINASATLNFPSIATNSSSDLTITVTGAALNDLVLIGVPNAAIISNISFFGWVSAANTVTIRCTNNSFMSAGDPPAGTFKVAVVQ